MKKTGEILKKAREEKGLALSEIGLSLKISSKVLKAIEEGDEKNLPAKTFLRGFVKSYANYLRLDTDKVLASFYEEYGSTRPQPYIRTLNDSVKEILPEEKAAATTEPSPEATVTTLHRVQPVQTKPSPAASKLKVEPYSPLQEKKNTKVIVICVIGAFLIGLIFFTKKMIDKYTKEAEIPAAPVEQSVDEPTPTLLEAPVEVSPEPNSLVNPRATPQTSPLSGLAKTTTAAVPATMATVKPTPSITPAIVPPKLKLSPAPTPSPTVEVTPAASPSPKPEEKNKPVELIVEALDSVEIEYAAPNGKPQKIKLSAEQVHTFKSRSGLKISFSNGGAINLILNGKELGIPGDLGKPIKLSY